MITLTNFTHAQSNIFDTKKMIIIEHQLEDVMEMIDTTILKTKIIEIEKAFEKDKSVLNKTRLGIIYHETALNLTFLPKSNYKGYAKKSYDLLTELSESEKSNLELMPFLVSYRASALSLLAGETMKLSLVGKAFEILKSAVNQYAEFSYLPEFLRGSIAENLPWIFFNKKKFVKIDMQSIIDKYEHEPNYAPNKVMSFVYWAWANQHQSQKDRNISLMYLEKSIGLDVNYVGGRKKAEDLKQKLNNN